MNTIPRVTTFNAANDFSITSNPNGFWQYGWSPTLGGNLNLYTRAESPFGNTTGIAGWFLYDNRTPDVVKNVSINPIIVASVSIAPGQLGFLPGPNGEYSVVRWIAPSSGFYDLATTFSGLDNTSTDVHVIRNTNQLFDGLVNGWGNSSSYTHALSIAPGDTIDFIVGIGSNGNNWFDATGIAATITAGGDVTVDANAPNTVINLFDIFEDTEDPDASLTYSLVGNTNPTLFTSAAIAGGNLTLDYAPNVNGTSNITLRATDTGGLSVDRTFKVTVNPTSSVPTEGDDILYGTSGNDIINGLGGNDQIYGLESNDQLYGSTGNDTLDGGDGSDYLEGDAGNDSLVGGAGDDYIATNTNLLGASNGIGTGIETVIGGAGNDIVVLDLGAETADLTVNYTDPNNGTISNGGILKEVEIVGLYTGSGNDNINLSAANNFASVVAGAGNDTIVAGPSNDIFLGGAGNDVLDGSGGTDRIVGDDGDDVLLGGDGNDNQAAISSPFGGSAPGGLYGGTGNDTLDGGAGNDYLEGDAGNDILIGGAGDDYIVTNTNNLTGTGIGTGVETVIGGAGNDIVLLDLGAETADLTVTYTDPNNGTISNGGILREVENVGLYAGSGNDNINLSAANFVSFRTGAGNDTLIASMGNDWLAGDAGNDTLDGSGGTDRIEGNEGDDVLLGGDGNDNYVAIGTPFGGVFYGGLYGGAGNDTLDGGAGNDYLEGDAGNDVFVFALNSGNDAIADFVKGEDKIDLTAYNTNFNDLRPNITQSGANTVINLGNGNSITLLNFTTANLDENDFIGLGAGGGAVPTEGDDILYGTPGNDTIDALGGNDLIFGLGANDSLLGGTGNDTIDPGLGTDTVDGGDGTDQLTVDYSSLTTDISSTNSGTSGTISTANNGVNYTNIEQMNLSGGSGNDSLVGTSGNDTLSGNGGEDYMVGGEGDDSLDGGVGNDTLDGGSGNNTLNGGAGDDTIDVSGSGTISGGDGNDTFIFYGPFIGIIDGGGGSDSIAIAPGVTQDIIFPGAPGVPGAISGIETIAVRSSSGNDYLIGGDGNDSLDGQGGNDTLDSRGGNDTLLGGTGNDVLKPGLGTDTVDGGAGDDLLVVDYSSLSTDVTSSHSNGSGSISTTDNRVDYANIDRLSLTTGSGNDVLTGTGGNDTLIAGNGTDSLFGDAGSDSLDGGSGNDTLSGANPTSANPGLAEIDTLAGGAGSDLFILGDSTWQAYDDRNAATDGTNDYATITGFNSSDGDTIQLQGPKSKYLLETSGSDTRLLIDKPGTEPDELIAVIQGVTGLDINSSNFAFVTPPNTPPTVTNISKSGNEDTAISFSTSDFTGAFSDGDGNSLTKIQITSLPSNGTLKLASTDVSLNQEIDAAQLGNLVFTPNANFNGSVSFGWNGFDGTAYASTPASVNLTVNSVNDAPAGTDKTIDATQNSPYTFTAADFGFSDPNDTPANVLKQVKVTTLPTTGSLIDNGTAVNAGDFVTVADINSGKLQFTSAAIGTPSFTFQLQDDGGTSNGGIDLDPTPNTITVNVTGAANNPPVANPDTTSTTAGTPVTINVLSNDTDLQGSNTINPASVDLDPSTPGTIDPTRIVAGEGTYAVDTTTGSVTFTPVPTFSGTSTISYTIADNQGATSQPASISVVVTAAPNNPPVNSVPGAQSLNEDGTLTFNSGNGNLISTSDVDSTNLIITLTVSNGILNLGSMPGGLAITNNATGTVTLSGDKTLINQALDGLQYIPNANYNGADTLQVVASDGSLSDTDTITLNITPVNDPATIAGTATAAVTEDTNVDANGKLNATGSLSITDVDAGENKFNTSVASAPGNLGSLSISENGAFSYSVDNSAVQSLGAGQTRTDTFTVKSFDGTASQDITVAIAGINDPATISGTATAAVIEDTNVDANGKLNATGSLTVTDVDAGENKFNTSVTSALGNLGSLSISENGAFSYSVDNSAVQYLDVSQIKTNTFTVKSFDGTASQDITVTITGQADNNFPTVNLSVSPSTGSEADKTAITVTATTSSNVVGDQTVDVSLTGTATSDDFTGKIPAKITIPGGQNSGFFTVNIADDTLAEIPETAIFTISNPSSGITLGSTTSGSVAIADNDSAGQVINGTNASETLTGTAFADTINGLGGSDLLNGLAGNDSINGGNGNDTLNGGTGIDFLDGGNGSDTYLWSTGNGRDFYQDTGTSGTDRIIASGTADFDGLQSPFSKATSGIDRIESDRGAFNILGDNATGDVWDFTGMTLVNATIQGQSGDDKIAGSNGAETIQGGSGADTLSGNGGGDLLDGGDGNDRLNGGNSNDTLNGGTGIDTLDGGNGGDTYLWSSGDGSDVYKDSGSNGTDKIVVSSTANFDELQSQFNKATSGIDRIESDQGAFTILGDNTIGDVWDFSGMTLVNATIQGQGGDDIITGTNGVNSIQGGNGNDKLFGSGGNDSLIGDSGNDSLNGGAGNDTLEGGAGNDTFIFSGAFGTDTILDFKNSGIDWIDLSTFSLANADLDTNKDTLINSNDAVASLVGGNLQLNLTGFGGGRIRLAGLTQINLADIIV